MKLIGHRGAPALAPENTVESVAAAVSSGADGVEIDVRLTADGVPVAMHDDETARTTGVAGRISEMAWADVRGLDAAATFPGARAPGRVPRLEDVLEAVPPDLPLVVELKGVIALDRYVPAAPVARVVAPLLATRPSLTVSSFDHASLAEARAVLPHARTAVTTYAFVAAEEALRFAVEQGHPECHVAEQRVDAAFVARAHEAGCLVYAWVVNAPERLRELHLLGCDGVFTDDPGAARRALEDA